MTSIFVNYFVLLPPWRPLYLSDKLQVWVVNDEWKWWNTFSSYQDCLIKLALNQSNHLIIYQSLFHFTSIFQFPCIVFLWLSPSELIAYTGSFKKSGTTIDIDRETSNISKLFVLLRASCKANCSVHAYTITETYVVIASSIPDMTAHSDEFTDEFTASRVKLSGTEKECT